MKARALLLAAAWLTTSVALADTDHPRPPGMDIDRMAILLDLNDTQKTEVQKILDEQHDKMRAAREQSVSEGTRPSRDEMMKLHEQSKQETVTKLQGVLNAEQIKKFEALTDRPIRMRKARD
jgi:Spy/CpxP family protein refolding chaperone